MKNEKEKTFTIKFYKKSSKRFKNFIARLYSCNKSPVYIWTAKSNNYGLFKIDSIKKINFSFKFKVNVEGIVVLLTENLQDTLILDYYENSKEERLLEITLQGKNWFSVAY